jgi:hypothetical protein
MVHYSMVPNPPRRPLLSRSLTHIILPSIRTDPNSRKDVLAGTRVLVQFLRGRHIILSRYGNAGIYQYIC